MLLIWTEHRNKDQGIHQDQTCCVLEQDTLLPESTGNTLIRVFSDVLVAFLFLIFAIIIRVGNSYYENPEFSTPTKILTDE